MKYYGDYLAGATVRMPWNSQGTDGASITRATNGTVKVYKDGNAASEVTTGVTDTEDFDTQIGCHYISIDLASDGTFYAAGHDYDVMLQGATIDGKTVNAWVGSFSIENRTQKADVRKWIGSTPNSLISGRPDVSVGSMQLDTLDATAVKTDGADEIGANARDKILAKTIDTLTIQQIIGVIAAAFGGKTDGFAAGGGTGHIRNVGDSLNRLTIVYDANNNRTTVTIDTTGL